MDDVIYRQDAIDALNKMKIYRPLDSDRYVISDCLNKIVNLPSAQQWIPCSERMPKEYDEVWVTLRGSDVIVCKDGETLVEAAERVWKENIRVSIGFYGSDGWYSIDGYPSMVSPVAWMPMNKPEPYKGEE